MASRLRIGAALLGATVALTLSALPASAEVQIKPDKDSSEQGRDVYLKGKKDKLDTSLIGLMVIDREETKVKAYCVELPTPLKDSLGLKEVPWDQHPNKDSLFRKNPDRNREKINWILHNSYPSVPANKLGSGVDAQEAIAGTQAAIWHFSDGAELDPDRTGNDDVVKVYEFLTGKDNVGIDAQPEPTLKVDPTFKEGKAGERIGPFTVTTTADKVKVKGKLPKGVTITDKDGKPLEQVNSDELSGAAAPGDKVTEFFVNVPKEAAAGEAKFALEVNATLEKGRLFVQKDAGDANKTQSLIVASPSKVTVDADAAAKWAAAPVVTQPSTPTSTTTTTPTTPTTTTTTPAAPGGGNDDDLASTGASILWPLSIGVVLVGAGAGALFFLRRKKASA